MKHAQADALCVLHERLRAIANLRYASGVGVGLRQPHGLNRVDDHRERGSPLELVEDRAQIRLGIDEERAVIRRAERAIGAQPNLRGDSSPQT